MPARLLRTHYTFQAVFRQLAEPSLVDPLGSIGPQLELLHTM
jgi:hypothetical protein